MDQEMASAAERQKPRPFSDGEAEAVAFVVCQSVGLHNGTASEDYIQLWHGDANLLRESLEAVPVQKARSPAPARTIAPTDLS